MDIKIGNKPAGRIQMLLRSDVVPMTAGEQDAVVRTAGRWWLSSEPFPGSCRFTSCVLDIASDLS